MRKFQSLIFTVLLTLTSFALAQNKKDITKMPGSEGLQIMNVDPGSVYEAMKVESGDVLLEVDSHRIQRIQEIEEIFKDMPIGQKVRIKVKHGDQIEEREMEVQAPGARLKKSAMPSPTPSKKKSKP